MMQIKSIDLRNGHIPAAAAIAQAGVAD